MKFQVKKEMLIEKEIQFPHFVKEGSRFIMWTDEHTAIQVNTDEKEPSVNLLKWEMTTPYSYCLGYAEISAEEFFEQYNALLNILFTFAKQK